MIDYEYRGPKDINYFSPHDYFIPLGEWLRSYREDERRKHYIAKKKAN